MGIALHLQKEGTVEEAKSIKWGWGEDMLTNRKGKHQESQVLIKLTQTKRTQILGAEHPDSVLFFQKGFFLIITKYHSASNTEAIHSIWNGHNAADLLLSNARQPYLYFYFWCAKQRLFKRLSNQLVQQTSLGTSSANWQNTNCLYLWRITDWFIL